MRGVLIFIASVLMGLHGIFEPKASAQTSQESNTTPTEDSKKISFDPGITGVQGALGAGITLLIPSTDEDNTMQWQLRQVDLKIHPRISPQIDATVVLGLTKLTQGPGDPVLVASINWKPSNTFELTGGRILNPVGLARQLAPHELIELTYAETGITAPFFEQGVMATWQLLSVFELGAGIVSGQGTSTESDFKPDGILVTRIKPVNGLTLGLDFQTGKQDEHWRHVLSLHAQSEIGMFFNQAEMVVNFDAENNQPTIGWYLLRIPLNFGCVEHCFLR